MSEKDKPSANDPAAHAPQVHERSASLSVGEPRVITRIIKEPSFTQNLSVEMRNWVKNRAKSFRGNLKADVTFCRAAVTASLAERKRSEVMSVVPIHISGLTGYLALVYQPRSSVFIHG